MRFGEAANIREHIYGPDTPQWRGYLDRQLQRGVTFDPTFVIYAASRDLMKARTAEWLPTYTLPRLMRFFEANREYPRLLFLRLDQRARAGLEEIL